MLREMKRTEGMSTSELIRRVLRDREAMLSRYVKRHPKLKDLGMTPELVDCLQRKLLASAPTKSGAKAEDLEKIMAQLQVDIEKLEGGEEGKKQ